MMVVRNLEATHSVGGNAIATKVLVKDIGDNAKGIGWNGTQYFLSLCIYGTDPFSHCVPT